MNQRYEQLDSLRGLAALSVLFTHMLNMFSGSPITTLLFKYGPLRGLVSGGEAVTLFFVLSGFVLSLPFHNGRKYSYPAYAIKRICRIYLPYIAAISLSFVCWKLFYTGTIQGLSNWFNNNWSTPLDEQTAVEHLMLVDTFTSNLNNVVWSLVHEMRVSLIFPFLMYPLLKWNYKWSLAIGLLLSVSSVAYQSLTNAPFTGTELYATVHYTSIFIVGALLAKHRSHIVNRVSKMSVKGKIMLLGFGVITYLYVHPSFVISFVIPNFHPYCRMVMDSWLVTGGAAVLITFSITSPRLSKFLHTRIARFLGKISYSLYLSHLAVLFTCMHLLYGKINAGIICMLATAAALAVSSLMYEAVERPAIKLGKVMAAMNLKAIPTVVSKSESS